MKKFLAAFIVILLIPGISAAMVIEPGTFGVSGNTSINYSKSTFEFDAGDQDIDTFGLRLAGLYYFMENLGAGLLVDYSSTDSNGADSSNLGIGPTVEYQFGLSEVMNLFVDGAVGFRKFEFEGGGDADGWFVGVGGGVSYFLSSSVSVDCRLGYEYDSIDVSGSDVTFTDLTVGAGLSIYLR